MSDSLKDRVDLRFLSGVIFFLSVVAVIAVCITTIVWHDVYYIERDTWSAAFFHFFAAVVAVATLALVIVPSALLYSRARRRLDLVSLCVGIIVILILGAEFYSLSLIHLKTGRLTNRCIERGMVRSVFRPNAKTRLIETVYAPFSAHFTGPIAWSTVHRSW